MSPVSRDRWQAVSPYLDDAIAMDGSERERLVASLRVATPQLAEDLEALLADQEVIERERFLEAGPVLLPEPEALTGVTLGAYTLVSLIGQGGMGSVWLAERNDGRFEGKAAVKLLNVALIGRTGEERFTREGSILARLSHPGIAHLIDAGVSAHGQPYLILEYVDGEHVDRYCDRVGLGIEARVRLFLDVLDAVAHAHANLIVHRDIKPSNVLVRTDGRVKLLDFGIAKLLEQESAGPLLTVEGVRLLTPEYAAPEQMTGEQITTTTDVYALGVLLYVLLGHRHPAGDATHTPADLIRAIVDATPARPSDIVTSPAERRMLRGDLDNIVAKALKKKPSERYASVGAFAEDLRRYLRHEPVSARADRMSYRAGKFIRRHAAGVAATAATVLLLTGVAGFYTVRLAAERDRARLQADKAAKVSELLTGLLTAADPFAGTREPTVRGVLDAGAERIQKELAGEPELQAEMLTVMGRVYQRLGVHDKASTLLEAAVKLQRGNTTDGNQGLAQTLNDLGVLLREKGDLPGSRPLLEEALGLRRRLLGNEHIHVAVTLVELGRVYQDEGRHSSAEPLLREALAIRRKALGEVHRETATSLNELALLLWRNGDLGAAEPLFRQALDVNRKTLATDHPNISSSMNNLALILAERGDFAGAEAHTREAVEMSRRSLGPNHPNLALQLTNLANFLREQGKHDQAEAAAREAVQLARAAFGDQHANTIMHRVTLGRVHLARGEAASAETLFREALEARRRSLPDSDWRVASTKSLLAGALMGAGRYAEAEPLLLEARAALKDIPGPQGREFKATLGRLASLYEATGRPEKAAAYRAPRK